MNESDDPVGVNRGTLSPCRGRSESPSRRLPPEAGEALSRADGNPSGSEATSPLMEVSRREDAEARVTEIELGMGDPCRGREDEPEHPPSRSPRRSMRQLKVVLTKEAAENIEAASAASGMIRTHYLAASMIVGSRMMRNALRDPTEADTLRGGTDSGGRR